MKIPYKAIHLEDAEIFSLEGIHKKYWKDFCDTCHTRIGFSPKIEGADSYENRFLQFKLFRIVQAEYLKWDAVMNWAVKEDDLDRFKAAFNLFCKLETEDQAELPSFVWSFADSLLKGYEAISYDMMSETDKRDFALHSIDHMQTNFERMGTPLLNCQSLDDLKNIKDNYQAVFFLCVQYCRTNKMREVGIEGYKDYPMKSELYKKVFPYISLLVATTLGHNLVVGNPNTRYIFVRNETSIPFVTCDQPVINLKKDDVDENGFVKDLEFYYPISPSAAIMISQNAQLEEFSEIIADESFVENKNKKMCENASLFIFANNEKILQRIMMSRTGD